VRIQQEQYKPASFQLVQFGVRGMSEWTRFASEDSNLPYRHLLEARADGMIVAATVGTVVDANLKACCTLRRIREESVDQP
jgi:hypothetical protein